MIEDSEFEETKLEPNEYFEELKTKLSQIELEQLENNRTFLSNELEKAHKLGQKNLTHKASFMWEILEKEMILHAKGVRQYIHRSDVVRFIDNVTPKNSVKIVELENYPRSIPDANMDDIIAAKELGLFDVLLVLYTDLANEEVNSPQQKEFAARNRDPVVFGMFIEDKINLKHDRLYFITDWEDEFCDLTFTRMLDKMSEMGIENPAKEITVDHAHVNRIVEMSKAEVNSINLKGVYSVEYKQKKTFMSMIKGIFIK